jgi:UDP-N-acetylmuramoyl-tripeptide--D-alanyl-D-alanine ligase
MNAMAMMTLQQAQDWIPCGRLVGDATVAISRVHTDTRTLEPGDLFVALRGERFDGGQFLAQAASQGAVAALCEPASQDLLAEAGLPGMIVPDAKAALGALASGWRKQFSLPLIAVTGSNGKTTVTQMIAAILRAWKGEGALATQGNFNNDIGVPLTLLRLRAAHEAAVVEMGMNHPGEIALLAGMTAPTVALVNNAQREHLEFMATVEAVARENGSVIESLGAQGVAVFPADDSFAPLWSELCGQRRRLTFSDAVEEGLGDVRGHGDWQDGAWSVTARTPEGSLNFRLGIAGRHNVRNALAAASCALAAGAPLDAIRAGLQAFEAVKGRSRAFSVFLAGRRVTVVDDTYNANPDSVRAAIEVLADCPRRGCWCWATWARWATRARSFMPRWVHCARSRHGAGCSRWARSRFTPRGVGRRSAFRRHGSAAGRRSRRRPGVASIARQGIAFHEDGAGGGSHHSVRAGTTRGMPSMLPSLAQWLQTLSPEFGFFRVFQYLTFRAVMAAMTALLIGLWPGPR